jgi:hypothetical protein
MVLGARLRARNDRCHEARRGPKSLSTQGKLSVPQALYKDPTFTKNRPSSPARRPLCAPGRTRTHDPLLRRQPLYPAELRGRAAFTLVAPRPVGGALTPWPCAPPGPRSLRRAGGRPPSDKLVRPVVAVAQVVRASGCGPEGRGFKSPRSPQLKSQLTADPPGSAVCVEGAATASRATIGQL